MKRADRKKPTRATLLNGLIKNHLAFQRRLTAQIEEETGKGAKMTQAGFVLVGPDGQIKVPNLYGSEAQARSYPAKPTRWWASIDKEGEYPPVVWSTRRAGLGATALWNKTHGRRRFVVRRVEVREV